MKQKTGVVKIWVNSVLMRSKKGAKLNVGGPKRELDEDASEPVYTEAKTAPRVEFTIQHTAGFSIKAWQAVTDGTITFECDTGPVFILQGACYLEGGELSDGEVNFVFAADSCTESLSG